MAEFQETVKEIKKICDTFAENCDRCPFAHLSDKATYGHCASEILNNPKQAEAILKQWKAAHIRKTSWAAKLIEMMPNADLDAMISGTCPGFFFPDAPRTSMDMECGGKCRTCWYGEACRSEGENAE